MFKRAGADIAIIIKICQSENKKHGEKSQEREEGFKKEGEEGEEALAVRSPGHAESVKRGTEEASLS